jgi:membrane-associated phospholipid phosphatase
MVLVREDRVMSSTVRLDGTEKLIFGSVPAVGFITRLSGSIVEQLILYSYWYLYLFFSAAVLITAFLNKWIFRTLLNAFFLSFLIALPIFLLFPATSPDSLYLAKIFNFVPQPLFTDDTLSTIYNSFIEAFHEIWISKTNSFFSVSSMPSLHVAWGLIATISVFKVHRKTGYLFILWFLLNSIGTFYSLQHYALDTVGGFLLGLCALHITNKLLLYEKTYYTGKNWYYVVDYLTDQKNKIQSMFHTFCSKF